MNNKKLNLLIWILTFLEALSLNSEIVSVRDDYIFGQALERYDGIIKWASFYGMNWSGRIIPHGILVILLQLPNWVFIVLNSLVLTGMLYLFVTMFAPKQRKIPSGISLLIILWMIVLREAHFLIPDTVLWKCAAVLYLWGIAGFFAVIRPGIQSMRGEKTTAKQWLVAYVGAFYTSGFEQMAAFMMVYLIAMSLWNSIIEKTETIRGWCLTLFAVVFSLFFACLPGNRVRAAAEVIAWLPSYDMFKLTDKLLMGIHLLLQFIFSSQVVLIIWIISILILVIICCKKNVRLVLRALAFEPVVYSSLATINVISRSSFFSSVIGSRFLTLQKVFEYIDSEMPVFTFEPQIIACTIFAMFTIFILGCLLFLAHIGESVDPVKSLFYFGGNGTIVLMGFSPTLHASGIRTHFICFMFLQFVLVMLFWEILQLLKSRFYKKT